jgi:Tfp pilus assembly protein PilN
VPDQILTDEAVGRAVKSVSLSTLYKVVGGIVGVAVAFTTWVLTIDQLKTDQTATAASLEVLDSRHSAEIREVETNKASVSDLDEVEKDLSRRVDNYAERWTVLMDRVRELELQMEREKAR